MEPPEVAQFIKEVRKTLGYDAPRAAYGDPSMDAEMKGESLFETFRQPGNDIYWQPAINRRWKQPTVSTAVKEMGWPRLGAWFRPDPLTGVPWLTFDPDHAAYFLRSIAALQASKTNAEDVNTDSDDHAADVCRYFAHSRPPVQRLVADAPILPANSIGALIASLRTPSRAVLGADLVRHA